LEPTVFLHDTAFALLQELYFPQTVAQVSLAVTTSIPEAKEHMQILLNETFIRIDQSSSPSAISLNSSEPVSLLPVSEANPLQISDNAYYVATRKGLLLMHGIKQR
jgi:hypothetical protein